MNKEFISPFIPLVITVIGSFTFGSLVRYFFVRLLNKKITQDYRYTYVQAKTQPLRSRADSIQGRSAKSDASGNEDGGAIDTPSDALSFYRGLLGLGPRFSGEELKTAYRSAAAAYHPDRYASSTRRERETAEDLMKKVNEAYECLKASAV